jgi:hypothetical protein
MFILGTPVPWELMVMGVYIDVYTCAPPHKRVGQEIEKRQFLKRVFEKN